MRGPPPGLPGGDGPYEPLVRLRQGCGCEEGADGRAPGGPDGMDIDAEAGRVRVDAAAVVDGLRSDPFHRQDARPTVVPGEERQ
ncbi:hypothetical protein [Peterkaempfera griseoplana]|uniref:hypothetical protein n=1 Tax=Peterkaempfera griseoplana TaxID=66896 RepID=UPI0006E38767|nr:hypothetical protein [Peterkaempfera griseoplana]